MAGAERGLGLALWALALLPVAANADPVVIAGGALDPAFANADVYLHDPAEATVPAGPACRAARAYVDYHRAGRYSDVPSLFADDAVLLEPSRLDVHGIDGIRRFYEKAIGALRPQIAAVHYQGDATDCMVELAVRQELGGRLRYRLASMDHFTVNAAGKVIRMVAFQRPSNLGLKPPEMKH